MALPMIRLVTRVGKGRAIALSVSFDSGAVAWIGAVVLLRARYSGEDDERRGIAHGAECELVLLFGGHRLRLPDVACIEILKYTEDALLLLLLNLRLRDLLGRCKDGRRGTCGYVHSYLRRLNCLAGGSRKTLERHSLRGRAQ